MPTEERRIRTGYSARNTPSAAEPAGAAIREAAAAM
jgi:hypothetical protein